MEITIGVRQAAKEITLNTDDRAEDVTEAISSAVADGQPLIRLTDKHGRTILIPTAALAYVEVGGNETRKVGFSV
ncbi:MAG: DUF3107 domain-containing protein [Bifidobacteriaceae bacterium]|jgi:hypothetical protein|nr:DUF3107 domain-containing protein [Bifidobacteriaceae bacterium]